MLFSSKKSSSNLITYSATSTRANNDHGTISTKFLGGALNVAIESALLLIGVDSVGALIKKMGKEAAKEWVEKSIKQSIIKKLSQLGLKEAEAIAANNKILSKGYIELW